jgi:uncharacterized protein (TIGR02391 family)
LFVLKRKLHQALRRAKVEQMAARKTQQETVPPTLSPCQGIRYLLRQIKRLEQHVISLPYNHRDVEGWISTTRDILNQTFGQPNGAMHSKTSDFLYARGGLQSHILPYGGHEDSQRRYLLTQEKRKALLRAYVEQLQDLVPPGSAAGSDFYVVHSEIDLVSSHLYRDGDFTQAVLEASIRVMDEVKRASGISDDGNSLMNKTFDIGKQMPVIQFNCLATEAEREEQRGAVHLFQGIAALCKSMAAGNGLFDDPIRAYEYLAFVSLLMRLLEIAQVNKEL